ncbi:FG-GAP-like repeat-containing protein [Streptomyces sp. NPDC090025]|uniref:FG-GAP-like repeat-containing protein n=1 Tax=Streptomyces sp. NPDC090025 TaxID=3365922 RepID=UPI0038377B07
MSFAPAAPAAGPSAPADDGTSVSRTEREARETAQALQAARSTGRPVEIVARRTETDEVYANPDGTYRVDRSILPVRVRRDAQLVPVDPRLVEQSDGRLAPRASAMGVTFSGGGDNAFVTMFRDGRALTLTWPRGPLPRPKVDDRTATYPEVLPGVDLTATADRAGFSHALVIKTAAAAKNPELAEVEFGLKTQGVEVARGDAGTIVVRTPARNALFSAPRPRMWDSGGSESATAVDPRTPKSAKPVRRSLQDTLEGAAEGGRQSALGVRVDSDRLTLIPDRVLLDDPKTVYPVVVDPVWAPDAWKNAWSIAYKHTAYPGTADTVYWNGGTISDYARVGAANDTQVGGTVRANTYFRVSTANTWGRQIIRSTLRIKQTHAGSWSCKSGDIQVRDVGSRLPTDITYNRQPSWGAVVDSSGESFGGRNCPADSAGLVEFDVTTAIAKAASSKWSTWAFVLTSKTNTIDVSWRKFDPDTARVSTYLNTPPARPVATVDPLVPCAGGTIGTTDHITLRAKVKDADDNGLKAEFRFGSTTASGYTSRIVDVSSGSTAAWRIPAGTALKSGSYWYDVIVRDGVASSPWAGRCEFTYDWSRPSKVPAVSSKEFPEDVAAPCPSADGKPCTNKARTDGVFEFSANGVGDVTKFVWWTDDDLRERSVAANKPGGSASVTFRPPRAGPQFLYVRSQDAADNRSDTRTYQLIPTRNAERDRPGDMNGDGNVDLVNVDPGTGQLWTYPGHRDGTFGTGQVASSRSFQDAVITSGGSWDDNEQYEDLIALRPAADNAAVRELWAYRGAGDGTLDESVDGLRRLTVLDEESAPEGENLAHWRQGAEIVSVPSFNDDNGDGALSDVDDPDLLVKEGGVLWLYLGKRGSDFLDETGAPIALGNADWQDMTVMSPGDLNKDGLPELWARDRGKGTIHQYSSRRSTASGGTTMADLTVYGESAARVESIGRGFTGAAYPHLATSGDFEGDGYSDLWSRDGEGVTVEFPGRALSGGSAFGAARRLVTTGTSWATCEKFPAVAGGESEICGPVLAKFKALGGTAAFGRPTSGLTAVADGGRYVNFARPGTTTTDRTISWSKFTGTWAVQGGIYTKWNSLGREGGLLGYPTSDERPTNVLGGSFSTFSRGGLAGAVYWSQGTGGHEMHGAIYAKYLALGGVAAYGYPVSDEMATDSKPGSYQNFRHGVTAGDNLSFYWSSQTGAWPVGGAIRGLWKSVGGHAGSLGFPTAAEYPVLGGRRSDFQTAYVRWNAEGGHVAQYAWQDRTAQLRTDLGGDFDGDGRTDVITAYDYQRDATGLFVARANDEGGHNPPLEVWSSTGFTHARTKWTAGDFNGDGRDDVAGVYGYADNSVAFWSFLSQPNGEARPVRGAVLPAGTWNWSLSTPMTGDLNGDGRDDLVLVYNYGGGATSIFKALARTDGTFDVPVVAFKSNPGDWYSENVRYAVGDTNGDGRDDVLGFYGYASGASALFTFTAKADGTLNPGLKSWTVATGWEWERVRPVAADFDLDGREDFGVLYGYDDGRNEVRLFSARSDGGFDGFVTSYASGAGSWYAVRTGTPVAGDVNGDRRPDITVSYNYAEGQTRVFSFYGNASAGVDSPVPTWYAEAGTW